LYGSYINFKIHIKKLSEDMIGSNKENSKYITVPVALSLLESRKKDGELGYEQQLAYEHASKSTSLSKDKSEKMLAKLVEINMPEKLAVKVIDIMPLNELQLKQVLVIGKRPIEEDMIKKIMEIVNSYRGK
jgi:DNA-directed RNA polymerase subunit F